LSYLLIGSMVPIEIRSEISTRLSHELWPPHIPTKT
jgi:hypothetical protein